MLQTLRGIITSSQSITAHYGVAAVSEQTVRRLALGAAVEIVFPDAFAWCPAGGEPLPVEMRRTLSVESRAVANKLQGRIMQRVREWLVLVWQQRCRYLDEVQHVPHGPPDILVTVRGAQVRDERGRGRGRGRGGGRQRTIMEFLGPARREGAADVGSSSNVATHPSGRGHVYNMPV